MVFSYWEHTRGCRVKEEKYILMPVTWVICRTCQAVILTASIVSTKAPSISRIIENLLQWALRMFMDPKCVTPTYELNYSYRNVNFTFCFTF